MVGRDKYTLYNEDCFRTFDRLARDSVDMVMVDPPYGTTACKWDSVIPLGPMWVQLKRVTKENGAMVFTASQPFTTILISSSLNLFKYELIWEKATASNFMHCNFQPMKSHENIVIFSCAGSAQGSANPMVYNPQHKDGRPYERGPRDTKLPTFRMKRSGTVCTDNKTGKRKPRSVIYFDNTKRGKSHPTQKPVALMEYLIKTYTNEDETVLDFAMGSGTTGVACGNLGRRFIGCDIDTEHGYFDIAKRRIKKAFCDTITAQCRKWADKAKNNS